MINRLFSIFVAPETAADDQAGRNRLAALRQAYEDWRFGRDFAAIMAAFGRMSDHQLHMIGLSRDTLFETVEDMMLDAERERALGREVAALLEVSPSAMQMDAEATVVKSDPDRKLQAA
ncbi:hypothetical protein CLV78_10733 [Aliiruegeria haliotis]|uniref:Uncharacterized protein n=1 Tax=Aliiruegeria haliotis TaxID=1280846 RepID=A0A2T0RLN9_9RHOB|nr:hypothetical protein [Aliiruegeria haliotis]PRY22109.1 hypothetical protein CLV78_10733 [Aliiruegeria haliotis]